MLSWRNKVEEDVVGLSPNSSGWVRVNCPACEDRVGREDCSRTLSVSKRHGWWKCFRCQWVGRLSDHTDDYEDFVGAGWIEDIVAIEDPGITVPIASKYAEVPKLYLKSRGISLEVAKAAGVSYCITGSYQQRRMVFPAIDYSGQLVGWVSRHPDGIAPKYRTASNMDRKHRFLRDYHVDNNIHTADDLHHIHNSIVLTEGPMDMLAMWEVGGIACMGKPTKEQLLRLAKCEKDIVVLLDGDAADEAEKCVRYIRNFGKENAWFIRLPADADPCSHRDLAVDAVKYCLENRMDIQAY